MDSPVDAALWESVSNQIVSLPIRSDDPFSNFLTALFLRDMDDETWETWNKKIREDYVAYQDKSRQEFGSWFFETKDRAAAEGGRLYATVSAILYLESYYRYAPLKEPEDSDE